MSHRPSNAAKLDANMCGMSCWHPEWLQRYATSKTFMAVYGLLGTIQATSYMYFVVTLTTIEKRFKIPSQTTGIILSGNEISQILLSLILSYVGGQRNRPRWIAWGIVFCGLSCYILALPHFIYGGGDDVMHLTEEYFNTFMDEDNTTVTLVNSTMVKQNQQLCGADAKPEECNGILSLVPLILIFLSQFVLGVGNTLYYSLGQTYLDDNSKKTNTPLMLSLAMSLRMIGPVFGFLLGYVSLNLFIEPGATPLIDNKDPRWLGAWWFGWMILGTLMVLFSGLIGLFPKQLPKKIPSLRNSHVPHVLRHEMLQNDDRQEGLPLGSAFSSMMALDNVPPAAEELPKLKDFPKALMRLLRNKLLIFNIISGIFYILGASGYMTFLTKYMEVQFHKSPQAATIIVGPVSIIGMVIGLIGSGLVISKKKPSPSKVLMWNVIVGFVYILGQVNYLFLYCGDSGAMLTDGKLNVTAQCNANCGCDGVPYSPVCHESSGVTYFSPCHAGCHSWNSDEKIYSDCSCLAADVFTSTTARTTMLYSTQAINSPNSALREAPPSVAVANVFPNALNRISSTTTTTLTTASLLTTEFLTTINEPSSAIATTTTTATATSTTTPTTTTTTASPTTTTETTTPSTTATETTTTSTTTPTATTPTTDTSTTTTTTTTTTSTSTTAMEEPIAIENIDEKLSSVEDELETLPPMDDDTTTSWLSRRRRDVEEIQTIIVDVLQPGVCLEGCSRAFWIFSIFSLILNWFGSSGRIGNILVNYRSVSAQDKSFAQGLSLMMISLFALIPGPIIFGRIIDSTCLVWTKTCNGHNGNCQLYDQATFRYMVNIMAMCLTSLGVLFDFLVWYYGRNLDLYGDGEQHHQEQNRRKNQPLTPLLTRE